MPQPTEDVVPELQLTAAVTATPPRQATTMATSTIQVHQAVAVPVPTATIATAATQTAITTTITQTPTITPVHHSAPQADAAAVQDSVAVQWAVQWADTVAAQAQVAAVVVKHCVAQPLPFHIQKSKTTKRVFGFK